MTTATEAMLKIDVRKNRARQYAVQLVHELSEGGFIADACRSGAAVHLAEIFYKQDVEITTAEQRHAKALTGF